jgi:hypothetical protein
MCGVISITRFGQNVLTNNFRSGAPQRLGASGPSDWDRSTFDPAPKIRGGASGERVVQSSLVPWLYRLPTTWRWSHRSDAVSVTAPVDPHLPNGGGYVVSGLYDVIPGKAGQVSNLIANSSDYGRWFQYFNGIDATLNLRAAGFTFIGGTSTGQTVADNCAVRARLPELSTTAAGSSLFGAGLANSTVSPVSPYCHVAFGIQTQFRGLASYELPGIGAQLSATFQSKPGTLLAANYAVPNAAVAASLGRELSGNASNVTVNLVAPGTLMEIGSTSRRSVAKILRHGGRER